MALAATSGVFELATLSSLAVVRQGSTSSRSGAHGLRQQGSIPGLKLQEQLRTRKLVACGSRRSFDGVLAVASQDGNIRDEEVWSPSKRSFMLTTAMTLAGAMILTGAVASSSADAAIQKVEGTERGEQDAVTTGIREKSMLSTGKGNTIREAAKTNTQASGGTIQGVPKLESPGGAYRSPQSRTKTVDEAGGKKSTPSGILQKRATASRP